MREKFDWQQFNVPTLRHVIRKLRARAIMFSHHHFNTRESKQSLVNLLDSQFEWVGAREGLDLLSHRRLKFELYHARGRFFLDPRYKQEL
tara:strand:+ start:162 stop:431 length:270 start_codon:yes stop_codon:yes gene_type:complete